MRLAEPLEHSYIGTTGKHRHRRVIVALASGKTFKREEGAECARKRTDAGLKPLGAFLALSINFRETKKKEESCFWQKNEGVILDHGNFEATK